MQKKEASDEEISSSLYRDWRAHRFDGILNTIKNMNSLQLYSVFKERPNGLTHLAHSLCLDPLIVEALIDRIDSSKNNEEKKHVEMIWSIANIKFMITFNLMVREGVPAVLLSRILDRCPYLLQLEDDNGYTSIYYCELNIDTLRMLLTRMKTSNVEYPIKKNLDYATPHATYVILSRKVDDVAHRCLELFIAAYPQIVKQPYAWHTAIQLEKTWLAYLFPGGDNGCCSKTLLHHMVDYNWNDEHILEYVNRNRLVLNTFVHFGTVLQSLIITRRWNLITQLWSILKPLCNVRNFQMAVPANYMYIGAKSIYQKNNMSNEDYLYEKREGLQMMPKRLRRKIIRATHLYLTDYKGYTPLGYLINYEKWSTIKRWLVKKRYHVRLDIFKYDVLQELSAKDQDEFWELAVENYMYHLSRRDPYRYGDKLCAESPNPECKKVILRRCQRTRICYPTPINWTALQKVSILESVEPVIANPDWNIYWLRLFSVFRKYPEFIVPFHYQDPEVRASKLLLVQGGMPLNTYISADKLKLEQELLLDGHVLSSAQVKVSQNGIASASPWFERAVINALRQPHRLMVITVILKNPQSSPDIVLYYTHLNFVLYDKVKNTLERFDPNGGTYSEEVESETDRNLELLIGNVIEKNVGKRPKWWSNIPYERARGIQTIDNVNEKYAYDPLGYCLSWCLFYLEIRLININSKVKSLMHRVRNIIIASGFNTTEYLRGYLRKQNNDIVPILHQIGLSPDELFKSPSDITVSRIHNYVSESFLNAMQY